MSHSCLLDLFVPIKGRTGSNSKSKQKFTTEFLRLCADRKRPFNFKLKIVVEFHFLENCSSDIDNLLKSLFDSLQAAGVIKNDKLIKKITVEIIEHSIYEGIAIKFFRK